MGRKMIPQEAEDPTLSPRQEAAVELLVGGASFQLVAETLGVNPSSLWRWRRTPHFEASLNRRRQEVWSQIHDGLRALVMKGVEAAAAKVEQGDEQLLLATLQLARGSVGKLWNIGPDDPDELIRRKGVDMARTRALERLTDRLVGALEAIESAEVEHPEGTLSRVSPNG
jgi:transposase-like protein